MKLILSIAILFLLQLSAFAQEDRATTQTETQTQTGTPSESPDESRNDSQSNAADVKFTVYELILQRNIFDSERSPRRRANDDERRTSASTAQAPVVEHVDLLGIWVPDDKPVAIIDGNRTESNSEIHVGKNLKGWEVESIDTSKVVLAKADKRIEWPVGQRIELTSDGDWKLAGTADRAAQPMKETGDATSGSGGARPAASGGSADEILKRMMERRQKESGK